MPSAKWPLTCLWALAAAGSALAAPGLAAPARDARGFPVISNPAVAPPGFNGAAKGEPPRVVPATPINMPPEIVTTGGPSWVFDGANPPPPPPPPPGRATAASPPCSRLVTDGCRQTYERASAIRRDVRSGN